MSKRRCPICRSKKWRKEPHSGIITCSEGHVLQVRSTPSRRYTLVMGLCLTFFLFTFFRYPLGQDYRNETNETTEFGPHALHKRTLKSIRSVKERSSKVNPICELSFEFIMKVHTYLLFIDGGVCVTVYHGERARFLYFQCLQVILRMQIKKLSELWKLPPEFEVNLILPIALSVCFIDT